ncbi:FecR domain-containing protein [Paraburkholderia bannensis]|uniref:FecR domain-containing protein n=1 Tax=Paraburkholderia bannensis TaxID=765414 RepID=UPI002ABE3DF1|nr:FecR domain-containing protein [Paraburkholderia bannensis]
MGTTSSPHAEGHEAKADFESLEQAANWYAALHAEGEGDERSEQREAWRAWLAARAEHRIAWAHIEAVSRRFAPLRVREVGQRDAAVTALRVSAKPIPGGRRRVLASVAALGASGLAAWLGYRHTLLGDIATAWRADYATGVGEQRAIELADGTHVWLNTASALDVDYDGERRLLTLKRGEILIDTAKDARARPFFVDTHDGRLQALGTRFAVRQTTPLTTLSVFEGVVQIRTRTGLTQRVGAGQQRAFTADAIAPAVAADRARETWSRGVILADDITLGALIAELGRYEYGHIGVDPRVANLRVVGRYPIGNPDQVLAMLARDLPISVRKPLPWWTTVEPR